MWVSETQHYACHQHMWHNHVPALSESECGTVTLESLYSSKKKADLRLKIASRTGGVSHVLVCNHRLRHPPLLANRAGNDQWETCPSRSTLCFKENLKKLWVRNSADPYFRSRRSHHNHVLKFLEAVRRVMHLTFRAFFSKEMPGSSK